jgi:hypothetical protein
MVPSPFIQSPCIHSPADNEIFKKNTDKKIRPDVTLGVIEIFICFLEGLLDNIPNL